MFSGVVDALLVVREADVDAGSTAVMGLDADGNGRDVLLVEGAYDEALTLVPDTHTIDVFHHQVVASEDVVEVLVVGRAVQVGEVWTLADASNPIALVQWLRIYLSHQNSPCSRGTTWMQSMPLARHISTT